MRQLDGDVDDGCGLVSRALHLSVRSPNIRDSCPSSPFCSVCSVEATWLLASWAATAGLGASATCQSSVTNYSSCACIFAVPSGGCTGVLDCGELTRLGSVIAGRGCHWGLRVSNNYRGNKARHRKKKRRAAQKVIYKQSINVQLGRGNRDGEHRSCSCKLFRRARPFDFGRARKSDQLPRQPCQLRTHYPSMPSPGFAVGVEKSCVMVPAPALACCCRYPAAQDHDSRTPLPTPYARSDVPRTRRAKPRSH